MTKTTDIVKTYGDNYGRIIGKTATFKIGDRDGVMYGVQPLDHPDMTHWLFEDEIIKCGFFESLYQRIKARYTRGKHVED